MSSSARKDKKPGRTFQDWVYPPFDQMYFDMVAETRMKSPRIWLQCYILCGEDVGQAQAAMAEYNYYEDHGFLPPERRYIDRIEFNLAGRPMLIFVWKKTGYAKKI